MSASTVWVAVVAAAAAMVLPGVTSEPPPDRPDLVDPTGTARHRGPGCNPVLSLGHGSLDSIVPAGEHISDMGGITVHIHQCVYYPEPSGISPSTGIVGAST